MRWPAMVLLATVLLAGTAVAGGETLDKLLRDGGGDGNAIPSTPAPLPTAETSLPTLDVFAASLLLTTLVTAGTKHVTRENVLDHKTRQAIHEYLWEVGAAHLRRLSDALDLSTTNASWHLTKLAKAGLVGEVKENGYRMYYPKGGGRILRDQCVLAAQLQSENAQSVVEYVSENPGSHQREIARALDVNHGTARWHLSRLAEAGILEERSQGRTTTYQLTDHAEHVLFSQTPSILETAGQPA